MSSIKDMNVRPGYDSLQIEILLTTGSEVAQNRTSS
jgi:hypothetical protein